MNVRCAERRKPHHNGVTTMKMVPSSTTSLTTSSPLFPSLGTSHYEQHLASRSSLARHPPGAGGDSRDPPPRDENCEEHRKHEDVRVVMRTASNHKLLWTSSPSFSSLGDGISDSASRLRHPTPSPSAHILWYVSPRRPPRQSNRSNRLFRSPTHPVATSTKRYRDVHRAVN